jgi:hypothetical protein
MYFSRLARPALLLMPLTALLVSGCAKSASEVQPAYVSPIQYENYSCAQLAAEAQRVSRRASELSGVQDSKADDDAVATGVAIVVFWPAAFLVGGDDHTTAELARMKGEFETIEKVSIQKNCRVDFRKQPARKAQQG